MRFKHASLALVGDARATLDDLTAVLEGWRVSAEYGRRICAEQTNWTPKSTASMRPVRDSVISQAEVIGILNGFCEPTDVVVCAAGSLPGDLHKLWRTGTPGGYHLENGYPDGYEIAAGLGVETGRTGRARST